MIIGIIGLGFVGDAIRHSFLNKNITLVLYDKFKNGGIGSLSDILSSHIIFMCLPTPFCNISNKYDLSSLSECLSYLSSNHYNGLVVIKSTVQPGTSEDFAILYNLKIIHNPEFLTARTAKFDFNNQSHIVLGKTSLISDQDFSILYDFYHFHFPLATISNCISGESESMKIFANSFYAVKVQLFNEFFLLSSSQGYNFNKIVDMMLLNGWINPMHTKVPGPDGKLSYGGACFPKDTKALLAMMQEFNTPCAVLKGCVDERDIMRPTD